MKTAGRATVLFSLLLAPVCTQDATDAAPPTGRFDLVISTLHDIYVGIEKDSARQNATMPEFQAWCDAESHCLGASFQEAVMKYGEATVTIREDMAQISGSESAIAETKEGTKDLQDGMAQLDNLRSEEAVEYTEEVGLNTESARTVDTALDKLKAYSTAPGQGALLQNMQHRFAPNKDYVAGVLHGIKKRLKRTRDQLDEGDESKALLHKSLATAKQEQMDAMDFEILDKGNLLAKAKLDLVQARRVYDEQHESAAHLTKMLTNVQQRCETKASRLKALRADQAREKKALAEAVAVLKAESANLQDPAGATLLQLASKHDHGASVQASKSVQRLKVKKAVQLMLTQSKNDADGMRKASEAVQGLIQAIEQHSKDATARKRFCDVQMRLKKDAKRTLDNQLSRIHARQDFLTSNMGMISTEVANLKQQTKTFLTNLKRLEAVRSREVRDHEDATRDRQLTIKVVTKAKSIVEGFDTPPGSRLLPAESSSLLKVGMAAQGINSSSPPETWKLGSSKQGTLGSSLVAMLETIVATFEKEQRDADEEESDAQQGLLQLRQDTKTLIDHKTGEISRLLSSKGLAAQELSEVRVDDVVKSASLATNQEARGILDKSCAELFANYQALQQKQSEQISELKDVAEMLSSSTDGKGK